MTPAERKVLHAAQSSATAQRNAAKRERRRMDALMRARRSAERQFKRGLGDRLLLAAGIDRAEMDKRLAKDRATVKAFLAKREAEAKRASGAVRRLHRERFRAHLRRLKHNPQPTPYSGQVPPVSEFLISATDIQIEGAIKSAKSIAPWQNSARAYLYTDDSPAPFTFDVGSYGLANITWWFTWTPPRDGLLSVSAFLFVNGYLDLWAYPGCGQSSSAAASMSSSLTITQLDALGKPFTDSSSPQTQLDRFASKDFEDSTGQIDYGGIDIADIVTTDQNFPLFGNGPVTIAVTLGLNIFASSGSAEVNLFDKDFSANVPAVLVSLP